MKLKNGDIVQFNNSLEFTYLILNITNAQENHVIANYICIGDSSVRRGAFPYHDIIVISQVIDTDI